MALRSRSRQGALLSGCFLLLLLLGHVSPGHFDESGSRVKCLLRKDKGLCTDTITRWYYDRYRKTCKEFVWGGCRGNDNNFRSEEECVETCYILKRVPQECQLNASLGTCNRLQIRYFFSLKTMKCEEFYYGGCRGNKNRFFTRSSCMDHCLPDKKFHGRFQ